MNEKIQEIQAMMDEKDIDVLLLHHPEELVMAFDYFPFWGRSFGFVFKNQSAILFIPANEPDIAMIQQNSTYDVQQIGEHDFITLAEYRKQQSLEKLKIGASLFPKNASIPANGAEQGGLPYEWWQELFALDDVTVVDESLLIQGFSRRKSQTAIEKIRQAHKIAEVGLQTFYDSLRPGVTEFDVALSIETSIKQKAMASGSRFVLCYPQIQAGKNTLASGTFNRTTMKILAEGELVLLEIAVCVNGYWLDLTRTSVVGTPSRQQFWHYQQVEKAQQAAIQAMKPGVALSQLQKLAKQSLATVHLADLFTHGLGHSVGYQYHDPALAIDELSTEFLEEGMILTIEPGIYGEEIGSGMRIEDNILVTKNGIEWLSKGLTGLQGEQKNDWKFGGEDDVEK